MLGRVGEGRVFELRLCARERGRREGAVRARLRIVHWLPDMSLFIFFTRRIRH